MKLYDRIKYRKNHQVAKVAVAKELLTIAYFLVKKNQKYNPAVLFEKRKPSCELV